MNRRAYAKTLRRIYRRICWPARRDALDLAFAGALVEQRLQQARRKHAKRRKSVPAPAPEGGRDGE